MFLPGIRHPEELSLCYPLEPSHLKQNYQNLKEAKRIKSTHPADTNTFIAATRGSSNSLDRSNGQCPATPPPPRSASATPVASQQVWFINQQAQPTIRRSAWSKSKFLFVIRPSNHLDFFIHNDKYCCNQTGKVPIFLTLVQRLFNPRRRMPAV